MATGQRIRDRMKRAKEGKADSQFGLYDLSDEHGARRNKFYRDFEIAMAMPDTEDEGTEPGFTKPRSLMFIEYGDSLTVLDVNASPIEFLISRGEMETPADEEGMAGVRYHTALRLRDLIGGAQIKGLRSMEMGMGGGGGGGSVDLPAYRLDCMNHLQRVRQAMEERWLFSMVEAIVFQDTWYDIRPTNGSTTASQRRGRERTISALLYGIDVAAAALRYLTWPTVMARWPEGTPKVPPAIRRLVPAR